MLAPNSSAPATENREGVQNNSATSIVSQKIGASVESELDRVLWDLVAGRIELTDCTPAIQALWTVAFCDGVKCANREDLERLTWERNLWFYLHKNPGKTIWDFNAHLWDELFVAKEVSA